jgi:hypothetical protein
MDKVLSEHGIGVPALAARYGIGRYQITDQWRPKRTQYLKTAHAETPAAAGSASCSTRSLSDQPGDLRVISRATGNVRSDAKAKSSTCFSMLPMPVQGPADNHRSGQRGRAYEMPDKASRKRVHC